MHVLMAAIHKFMSLVIMVTHPCRYTYFMTVLFIYIDQELDLNAYMTRCLYSYCMCFILNLYRYHLNQSVLTLLSHNTRHLLQSKKKMMKLQRVTSKSMMQEFMMSQAALEMWTW